MEENVRFDRGGQDVLKPDEEKSLKRLALALKEEAEKPLMKEGRE